MGSNVIERHGIIVRRLALSFEEGPGYEITVLGEMTRLTLAEFRKVVLDLVDHLKETGAMSDKLGDARYFLEAAGQSGGDASMEKRFSALRVSVQKILEYLEEAEG